MSKLNDLIKELCPDGVEYKKLNEISEMKRGTSVTKKDIIEGDIPVISGGREPAYYCDTFNRDGETITVAGSGAGAGYVQYWTVPIFVCDAFSIKGKDCVKTKYLYYYLSNMQEYIYSTKKGGGVPHVHISSIDNMKIPVPPLPVQCEIVRILDNFTALTSALTAELTAQRKRYSGLLNSLLSFEGRGAKDGVLWGKLGDIATEIYRGAGIKRDEVTEKGIQCVRYGEIYTSYNIWFDTCISHTIENKIASKKYFEKGDILFAITGESVEEIAKSCAYVGDEKCLAGGDIVVMKHKQNPKYLAYALATTNAQMQKSKGKVKSKVVHSSVPAIKEIVIPIPSLEEQQRIVDILDRFDKLCNDLSEGLPAEIAARQKQYEYYRDKLLTFKEKKA